MLLADATVIQLEIGGVVAIISAIVGGLAAGFTGASKVLTNYLKAKDDKHRAEIAAGNKAVTVIIQDFRQLVIQSDAKDSRHDAEFRLLYDNLLKLHAATAATMGEMKTAIMTLADRVGRIEQDHPQVKNDL